MKTTVFDKDIVHGIITATIRRSDKATVTWNYVKALGKLSRNRNITVTAPDKEGGIILDTNTLIKNWTLPQGIVYLWENQE